MANPAPPAPTSVDFHFDTMCPYAYQTSKWMRSVRDQLGLDVRWRFVSLEEINLQPGKKHPWEWDWSYGWSMMRIGVLLRRKDNALLDTWYETCGKALHEDGRRPHEPGVARDLLESIGLDPGLVDESIADQTTHDEIKADHRRVIEAGGLGVEETGAGVPTLIFPDGQAMFGPVLIDPPEGDAAVRLWESVCAWLEFPHVFELQRPRSRENLAAVRQTFRPYLEARDWKAINRGKEM